MAQGLFANCIAIHLCTNPWQTPEEGESGTGYTERMCHLTKGKKWTFWGVISKGGGPIVVFLLGWPWVLFWGSTCTVAINHCPLAIGPTVSFAEGRGAAPGEGDAAALHHQPAVVRVEHQVGQRSARLDQHLRAGGVCLHRAAGGSAVGEAPPPPPGVP